MAGKLTDEQRQEIVRRYEAGESVLGLSKAYHCSTNAVRGILKASGIRLRGQKEANWLALGREPVSVSAEALWDAYASPKSRYPSVKALARRWGVCDSTVRGWLRRAGIRIRPLDEQITIELQTGRMKPVVVQREKLVFAHLVESAPWNKGVRCRESTKSKIRAALSTKLTVRCRWCGNEMTRKPSDLGVRTGTACCSRSHAQFMRWHECKQGIEAPRPLILARLRELVRQEPYRALPWIYETLEKAGATIGATDIELSEVFIEGRE